MATTEEIRSQLAELVNDVAGQCLQAPATVDDPLRLAVCDSSSAAQRRIASLSRACAHTT